MTGSMALRVFLGAFALNGSLAALAGPITIDTVPVGDAGNANDPATGNLYGGVSYDYRIGTTEVTNAQYVAFLNEKAKSDPLGLYNTSMGSDVRGGISRTGVSGSFSYATKTSMADKPVNYVSWYDAIRFANWVNNGQGAADTENGAYTLLGGTATPSNGPNIPRNGDALWFVPSENEWYKAAYYQPADQAGRGHVVVLVAHRVRAAQRTRELLVVGRQFRQHVLRGRRTRRCCPAAAGAARCRRSSAGSCRRSCGHARRCRRSWRRSGPDCSSSSR